jgi:hypothetical protein
MDSFIEQITAIRKTLLGVSISALILAPLAIGLSIYLLLHPSFFAILEIGDESDHILRVLLGAVVIISLYGLHEELNNIIKFLECKKCDGYKRKRIGR